MIQSFAYNIQTGKIVSNPKRVAFARDYRVAYFERNWDEHPAWVVADAVFDVFTPAWHSMEPVTFAQASEICRAYHNDEKKFFQLIGGSVEEFGSDMPLITLDQLRDMGRNM